MMHVPAPIPSSTMTAWSVPRPAPPDPLLPLAGGLRPVVNENRQVNPAAQHSLEWDGMPADALAMHDCVLTMLDQTGYGDSDAEDGTGVHARPGDHRLDALDDVADRVLGIEHGHVGHRRMPRAHVQSEVEQIDQERGLPEIKAD